jgi:MFS superfamily sulfate permease-like transporter
VSGAPDPTGPGAPGDPGDPTVAARRLAGVIAATIGGAMHLVVGGFFLATGTIAPTWAAAGLGLVWLALAVLLWRWRRTRPLVALALPLVAAAVWWAAIRAGEHWLGWSA